MAAWGVPDGRLAAWVPPGLRLDRVAGRAWVCVAAAIVEQPTFLGVTRLFGARVAAAGLLVAVRDSHRRGWALVRGYTSDARLARLARWAWDEPLRPACVEAREDGVDLALGGRVHSFTWRAEGDWVHPGRDSPEGLLIERRFAYTPATAMIRLERPPWRVRERAAVTIAGEAAALWGPAWAFLGDQAPELAVAAEGSELTVHPRRAWDGGADDRRASVTARAT